LTEEAEVVEHDSFLSVGRILRISAQKYPHRSALEFEDRTYTFAQLDAEVDVVAGLFQALGLVNDDRVFMLAENSPAYVRAIYAASRLGLVAMPANSMLTAHDIASLLDLSRPRHVVAGEAYLAKVREALSLSKECGDLPVTVLHRDDRVTDVGGRVVDVVAEARGGVAAPVPSRPVLDTDPGIILFTSGSTGTPKGIVKSVRSIAWSALNHQISEPRRSGDREAFCLALAGIAFANFVLLDALVGATCVLEPQFEPERLARTLATKGITHVFTAPTMVAAIARDLPEVQFPSVRVVETSFEFPLELRHQAVRMFPNAQVLWSFGSTEATMARTPMEYLLSDVSCVGYPGGLDEYRISPDDIDDDGVGEVQSYGPSLMIGYLSTEGDDFSARRGVRPDGWFDTGDRGWLDADHALHFAGRVKDMIKSGGANVYANEVETVLVAHPGVRNAAVLGLDDDYWGEIVAAVVEVDEPESFELDDLRRFATDRLAGFRRPKVYFLLDDLPKNPTGKIAKGHLRDEIRAGVLRPREP
jgi:acyl-CoA synthetase (AMP-forming)/AMP-acid ligase II